ncbi:hypothetical protein [Natronolimnohabitans innermongolicus]|uniref:Uncharacterized protein n=1 Tax=Natronolimnohabitans innermongolicus JCM 12255 TaxID=1227499 RepID=L9WL65_9EURY|nr:hypothetical protein [Natronolimnohabitans innermongolicus]ELY50204.1 hypothetical protein C493_19596 [Natronolimnohabitans innermongolicus JCM 12255]
MTRREHLRSLGANRRAVVWGAITSTGVFALFGLVTGLVPNPLFVRMVPRTGFDYLFLTLTALLAGVYVAQRLATDVRGGSDPQRDPVDRDGHGEHDHAHRTDENDDETTTDRLAFSGLIGGFLAVSCPICNAVLLALFGSSALMTYFDPLRPLLGAVSVALLAGLIYLRHSRTCPTCASRA